MGDDTLKQEARAVRGLRKSVIRYAQDLRAAVVTARRAIDERERSAAQTLERRETRLRRAVAALERAEADARRSDERDRETARRRVEAAARAVREEKAARDRARKAHEVVRTTKSDLVKTLHAVEAAVAERGSVAAHVLAQLDARLTEIEGDRGLNFIQKTAIVVGTVGQLSTTGAQLTELAATPAFSAAVEPTTLSEIERDRSANLQDQFADWAEIRLENEARRRREIRDEDQG